MKPELERRVIDELVKASMDGREFLYYNEIQKRTRISGAALHRILPRLIKRGWIRKEKLWIRYSKKDNPRRDGWTMNLLGTEEAKEYHLPMRYRHTAKYRDIPPGFLLPEKLAQEYTGQIRREEKEHHI
jgi:DNA-binding Lrp family transcriptional regulator